MILSFFKGWQRTSLSFFKGSKETALVSLPKAQGDSFRNTISLEKIQRAVQIDLFSYLQLEFRLRHVV